MKLAAFLPSLLFVSAVSTARADWPQWRGPERNGTAAASATLPDRLSDENPPVQVWKSIDVPSDHYGGHGSVAVADGRLYLSVVWHRDEPTETRRIDRDVLASLGFRGTGSLPDEVVEKMETDRMNLSRRLRGAALDEWADKWVEENLDAKTQLSLGSWVASRFKKGNAAIPLEVYDTLQSVSNKEFADQTELEAWVEEQQFEPSIHDQILAAVPNTKKVAEDVVLCFDAGTGEPVWKFETEGVPSGRSSSSTPAVADGRVYAALSTNIYCVDAESGEEIWQAPLTGRKGPASSPLVHDGRVFLQQNHLSAFDAETGEELWQSKDVKGSNSSPARWQNTILCNSSNTLLGIEPVSGETLWSRPGGGDGTPVVSGDHVVVSSRLDDKNLIAYRLSDEEPEKLWSMGFMARRYSSSPIIHDGHVYYLGSERHLCVDLETGETRWERKAQSSISSPLLADGKLLVYENRGGFASLLATNPDDYQSLGRAKVGALFCASPALVGKDLFLRTSDSVACYRFE
ncbi:MAG: PQQ-binding-like beta-propeller repeat protein [Verrucomicrobiales bacterium]